MVHHSNEASDGDEHNIPNYTFLHARGADTELAGMEEANEAISIVNKLMNQHNDDDNEIAAAAALKVSYIYVWAFLFLFLMLYL